MGVRTGHSEPLWVYERRYIRIHGLLLWRASNCGFWMNCLWSNQGIAILYLRVSATNDSFFSAAEDLDIIQDVRARTRGCSVSSNHNNRSHVDTVPKQLQRFFISSRLLCEYYKHYTSRVVLRKNFHAVASNAPLLMLAKVYHTKRCNARSKDMPS